VVRPVWSAGCADTSHFRRCEKARSGQAAVLVRVSVLGSVEPVQFASGRAGARVISADRASCRRNRGPDGIFLRQVPPCYGAAWGVKMRCRRVRQLVLAGGDVGLSAQALRIDREHWSMPKTLWPMLGTSSTQDRLNVVAACRVTGSVPKGSNCPANISVGTLVCTGLATGGFAGRTFHRVHTSR